MANQYKINVCGKEYNLSSEDNKDYTVKLAQILDKRIRDMKSKHQSLSVTDCAVLTALDCLDELAQANRNIDNIRSQIKDYVDDASRARNQANSAQREIRTLKERVAALETELKERTNYNPSEELEEPLNASAILDQDIRDAIEKPAGYSFGADAKTADRNGKA